MLPLQILEKQTFYFVIIFFILFGDPIIHNVL